MTTIETVATDRLARLAVANVLSAIFAEPVDVADVLAIRETRRGYLIVDVRTPEPETGEPVYGSVELEYDEETETFELR